MEIKFKNGSSIENINDESDIKRSQRGKKQISRMSEQIKYWQRNPDKYIEFVTGLKLPWWKRAWMKLSCYWEKVINYRRFYV